MLAALGLVLRGVWFFALGVVCLLAAWRVYAQREGRALALGPGVAASGALYLHAVLRFIDAPASLHHVQPTAEVLCALCAVLFFAALLRAAAPEGGAARRDVPRRAGSVLFLRLLGPAAACVAALHRRSGRHACFGGVCAGVAGPLGRGGCLWGNGGQRCRAGRALTALWEEKPPRKGLLFGME